MLAGSIIGPGGFSFVSEMVQVSGFPLQKAFMDDVLSMVNILTKATSIICLAVCHDVMMLILSVWITNDFFSIAALVLYTVFERSL